MTIFNTQVNLEYASVSVTSKPSSGEIKPISVNVILGSRVSQMDIHLYKWLLDVNA